MSRDKVLDRSKGAHRVIVTRGLAGKFFVVCHGPNDSFCIWSYLSKAGALDAAFDYLDRS